MNTSLIKGLLVGLILATSSLYADSSIYLALHSYHYDTSKNFNSSHNIIGGQIGSYEAFTFVNSKGRDSWYLGYINRKAYQFSDRLSVGYSVGLVSGYGDNVVPFVFPMVAYRYKKVGAELIILANQGVALRLRYIF